MSVCCAAPTSLPPGTSSLWCSCIDQKKMKPGAFPAVNAIWPERRLIRILESSRQTFHPFPLILRISKDSGGGVEEQSRRSWTLPSALVKPYSLTWRPATPELMLRVTVPPQLHPFPEPSGWCVLLKAPEEEASVLSFAKAAITRSYPDTANKFFGSFISFWTGQVSEIASWNDWDTTLLALFQT